MGLSPEYLVMEMQTHLVKARTVFSAADRTGRDLTASEQAAVQGHLDAANSLKARAEHARADQQTMEAIRQIGNKIGVSEGGGVMSGKINALGGGSWGAELIKQHGFKELNPSGAALVTVPLSPQPVTSVAPVLAMRQLVPHVVDTVGRWSYLRTTGPRTSNAGAVPAGGKKPTTDTPLTRVEGKASTLAHLSSPLNRVDLADAPQLERFIDDELRYGLEMELEDQIINGDGVGANFTGLAHTSGIQTQAWATDLLTTTRKAVTKLESFNFVPTGWVLSPADWERIELSGNDLGYAFAQAGAGIPIDRATRRLWGAPVALSTTVPAGVGWLADFQSATALHMREEARIDWSENLYSPDQFGDGVGGSLFEANMVLYRAELRAGFDTLWPAAIVQLDLVA